MALVWELTETTCVNDGDGAHGLNEMLCSKTWSRLGHSRYVHLFSRQDLYTDIDVTTIDAASCISYTERMGFQEVHQSKISLVGLL